MHPEHSLHAGYTSHLLRQWQSAETKLGRENFVYPIFLSQNPQEFELIPSLIDQYRIGLDKLIDYLNPLVAKGLRSVLLFGVISTDQKDGIASYADNPDGVVIRAVEKLKQSYPALVVICDVCLCAYTDHGHCGILTEAGLIDTRATLKRLSEIGLAFSRAGADIIAPSDMMDGRVKAIKEAIDRSNLTEKVSIMSYSSKFASSFYGPFRDAAKSAPAFGDRKCYQLPPGSRGLAIRAALRDAEEGAHFIMVKPATPYLDIVNELRHQLPYHPLAVYHVSGEYAMLMHAAKAGSIDLKQAALELMVSFRRAGASIIITYLTPYLLDLHLDDACG